MPPRRLYAHIGLQKTGTTYLQAVLLANREELARQGLDLVPASKRECFELMLNVRDRYHPGRDPESVTGALDRFTHQLSVASGPRAVLSQESLAASRPAQVQRFLEACGDREVHVVLTVRDLARAIPSAWQQDIKAGRTMAYPAYLETLQRLEREKRGSHPWVQLDPPRVLSRWADHLPPDRIHVVTVPPSGSPPGLLLERFCRVLEVDPATLRPDDSAKNTSLGRVQAEVLRRVNAELPDSVRRRQVYGDVGKRFLAVQVLGAQESDRTRVPADLRGWCQDVTSRQTGALVAAGYRVVGTLDDLRCPDEAFSDHERPPGEPEVAAAAVAALSRVLVLRAKESGGRAKEGQRLRTPRRVRRLAARIRGRRRPS